MHEEISKPFAIYNAKIIQGKKIKQWQIQDFYGGGGGGGVCKRLCARMHITSAKSVTAGVQARLRALEALGGF